MIANLIENLRNQLEFFPFWGQVLSWILLAGLVLVFVIVLFTLFLTPLMFFYNRLTDGNQSNALSAEEYVLGEVTEKIQGNSLGEVMETGSGEAYSIHPARLYRQKEIEENLRLNVGTKVLIIDFDDQGVALVVKASEFLSK